MKTDIKSMSFEELSRAMTDAGEPAFRGGQIFKWLSRGVRGFEEMTDISRKLRADLEEKYYITSPALIQKHLSAGDGTEKYLWQLGDKNAVESVLMSYEYGRTVCISTQAGCRMGCAFCASTLGGLDRNLLPSEMLDQVIFSEKEAGMPVSNVVLMGIGEPLDNFDNVIRFLELISHPQGRNIGMRHITLSTCGLTERIDKLSDYNLQLTLSVSLHAPDDETRSLLMPVNRGGGVRELLAACARYFEKTGRRVTFEYAMIDGVNDTGESAGKLAGLLKGFPAHVNLIPLNMVKERSFLPSRPSNIKVFADILRRNGVNVTLRRSLGGDVDASCGQLRRQAQRGAAKESGA